MRPADSTIQKIKNDSSQMVNIKNMAAEKNITIKKCLLSTLSICTG